MPQVSMSAIYNMYIGMWNTFSSIVSVSQAVVEAYHSNWAHPVLELCMFLCTHGVDADEGREGEESLGRSLSSYSGWYTTLISEFPGSQWCNMCSTCTYICVYVFPHPMNNTEELCEYNAREKSNFLRFFCLRKCAGTCQDLLRKWYSTGQNFLKVRKFCPVLQN